MKGIVGELRKMKIPLKSDVNPIKQSPYRLNPMYKKKVHKELDRILEERVIKPIEESKWVITMVLKDNKTEKINICVGLRKLNDACAHDSFPTLFTNKVLESFRGQEAYSFMDGFS